MTPRDKQREFLALADDAGPLPIGMLAQSTLAPPCAWCTPEERAAYALCVCTAELTDAVVDLCREIASVAPLSMLDDCEDMHGVHRYTVSPNAFSLEHLRRILDWEAPDGT